MPGAARRSAGAAQGAAQDAAGGGLRSPRSRRRCAAPISRLVRSASSTWGTCPQSVEHTWRAPGRASATWRAKPAGRGGRGRPRRTAPGARAGRAGRRSPRSPSRRVEVDVARGGEERDPGGARAVDAAELVDGDVGGGRVEALRAGEQAPELLADDRALAAGAGSRPARGAAAAPAARARAAAEGERRGEQAQRRGPLGRLESATSIATRPPIELPTRWARSIAIASM